jgi:predicted chitinase
LSGQGFGLGTADGSFGDRTLQATAEFQRRNGLGSDGVVGPGTLAKARELGFAEDEDAGDTPAGGSQAGGSAGASGSLTEQALAQIMPNLKADKRAAFFPFLTGAMAEFAINTPARQAAFLAQLAHESAEFRFMEEIWGPTPAQKRYEGRRDLGNTQPGDGFRYKGRGPIQVTGRANYKRYGDLLGIDLVGSPQLAATPEVGFRIAGLYWRTNGINAMADRQDIVAVTRAINGGTNGLDDRKKYYDRARRVLGVSSGTRSIGGAPSTTRDVEEETGPRLTRGLDEPGEATPTAAERNAPETAGAAQAGAGKASASGAAAKGGAKAATKKAAKKSAQKSAAKKSGAKKSAAGKSAAKKSAAKKSTAKKSSVKKSAAKKSAAKKSVAKKSAAKKSAAGKASSKKAASGKSTTKKSASKKSAKGAASKKSSGKGASKKGAKGGAGGRGGRGGR